MSDPVQTDLTLQINLCPGDVAYAELTVPRLVQAHPTAARRLAIVDACRPQRTRIYDPERRLPAAVFQPRLTRLREQVARFQHDGLFDEVVWLEPDSAHFARLARRYVRPWMTETHDYGGCAFMGYWAALEFPTTRFVLHYDADVCLYQEPGFDWTTEARRLWEDQPTAIAASPRISPPGFARSAADDGPSRHEGRPRTTVPGGWLNDWFSTRCLLVDRTRLEPRLPLISRGRGVVHGLRRLLDRGYPIGPEILLFKTLGARGLRRLNLSTARAWILHPHQKPPAYLALLPRLLEAVAAGRVPPEQLGQSEIDLPAWERFLAKLPSPPA